MVLQVIKNRITKIGIEFTPYYLFQEGINSTEMPKIKGIISDYSFEFLGPEDMKIIGTNTSGYSEEKLLGFLKAGGKCLGMKYKGRIAAFMWINFNEINYKSISIPLRSNEAYLWNMFTIESHRGKNLASYLRYKGYEILKEMGRDKVYSVSELFNSPALKFKKKLKNTRKQKLLLYIRLFKRFQWNFPLKTY
jgi:GNAT superfamily N-acetyltransferase